MDLLITLDSVLRNLQAAIKSVGLYPPTHPFTAKFFGRILEDLEAILDEHESLVLGVFDHALVVRGIPIAGTDPVAMAFAARLEDRGIGSLAFQRGCRSADVSQCVQILAMPYDVFKSLGDVEEILPGRDVHTIRLSRLGPADGEVKKEWDRDGLDRCLKLYRETVGSAKRILTDARMGKIPSLVEAQETVAGLVDGVLRDQNIMLALTMIKSYDNYLYAHSVNVGVLCIALGGSLGLDSDMIKELGLGAFLHDIGKVQWPEKIYLKPRGLNDEEWALVHRHPLDGAAIVEKMGNMSPTAMEVILEHHLRYDRKGYPIVDPEKEAGFFGMIGQLADAYDAMTTARAYQNAFEPSRAVARMQNLSGTVFDPKLLDAFIRMVGIYPVGSLVRLSSGELALVVKPNPTDASRPTLRLLFDRTGRRLAEEQEVDLIERDPETGQHRRTIVMAVDPASKNFDVASYLAAQGKGLGSGVPGRSADSP